MRHETMSGENATITAFQYPQSSEPPIAFWVDLNEKSPVRQTPECDLDATSNLGRKATDDGSWKDAEREAVDESLIFEEGRQQGVEDGRRAEREEQSAVAAAVKIQRMEQVARCLENFRDERAQYFAEVEHEVVKLALAIASRILRREAHVDPLLLTGSVRVALGQLSQTAQPRLRVPASDLELWTESIAHIPNLPVRPIVLAEEGMQTGECRIETEVGSADLGIQAQFGEIERGFFDCAAVTNPQRTASGRGNTKEFLAPRTQS